MADPIQNLTRGVDQYKYYFNAIPLTGVIEDGFTVDGDDSEVAVANRVEGKAASMRVRPGIRQNGSITLRKSAYESQFETGLKAGGLAGPELLAPAVFIEEVFDYVEGETIDGGVGKKRVLQSNPVATRSWTAFILQNPRENKAEGTVTLSWSGTVNPT